MEPRVPGAVEREPGIDLTTTERPSDPREESSIGDLLSRTTRDLGDLLRKEVELARTELREEAVAAGRASAALVVGALVVYLAVLLALLAAAWGLAEAVPLWLSLLIVAAVTGAVGAALVLAGKNRLAAIRPVPNTIQTIEEDARWAKQQMS